MSYIFLSIPLFRFRFYFLIISGFFLIFSLDSISRFSIDPLKTTVFGILSTLLIIFSYLPEAIVPYTFEDGSKSFSTQGPLVIINSLIFGLIGLLFVIYCADLYISSPTEIKKWARINLIGATVFGLLPTIFYATRLTIIIPGCGFLAVSCGSIILTLAFVIQPQLQDVLLDASRNVTTQMRKKLEDQLLEKEEHYQSLFTSISEAVTVNEVIFDETGKSIDFIVKGVNPAYEVLFDMPKKETIGGKGSDLYPEMVSTILKNYDHTKEKRQPQAFELSFKDLKKKFLISLFPLPKEGEFAKIFMDITN